MHAIQRAQARAESRVMVRLPLKHVGTKARQHQGNTHYEAMVLPRAGSVGVSFLSFMGARNPTIPAPHCASRSGQCRASQNADARNLMSPPPPPMPMPPSPPPRRTRQLPNSLSQGQATACPSGRPTPTASRRQCADCIPTHPSAPTRGAATNAPAGVSQCGTSKPGCAAHATLSDLQLKRL